MTDRPSDHDSNGRIVPATLACPACGLISAPGDFVRGQSRYECAHCETELSTVDVTQFLSASAVEPPATPAVAPTLRSAAAIPLFKSDGFMWAMVYFVVSAFLLFADSQTIRLGLTQAIVIGLVAHLVAVGALLTRSRWGLYVAYAFLGGRALVGLLGGAPPQPFGIVELLTNWGSWAFAVVAPVAVLVWLAINSHYFGSKQS